MDMPIRMTGCVAREGIKPIMGFHPYGWVFQLLILLAVGFIIYWVIKGNRNESAMEIVRRRYAKGEISEKEFNKIKKDLS